MNRIDNRSLLLGKSLDENKSITIAVINGPNINKLGIREPGFYGIETWNDIELRLKKLGNQLSIKLVFFQSNHEGYLVDFIQDHLSTIDGIVINPAAYTKAGYAILDAITAIDIPFVEIHLSNIYERGGWHSQSIFAEKAVGHIVGFKGYGYDLSLIAIHNVLKNKGKQ
ncbi:type II 3-dehydroquinate dehydratase [Paenibacillus macquariensis]|uniref:type II 3-dehydroquinate dehydratase n=1 Tax=Paenibacillus macquariensis TaxID=948756 RepID=UPI001FCE00A5|nr:type II 3-dehydroquinate dehydratase [Paenibacillus macquariensis]MEC0090213.1 3-dehydroquinate dehydratase [Paenibacillus macquariensis]